MLFRSPYYVVDSSCIVPMSLLRKQEYAAYTIRPKIHRLLDECLQPVEPIRVKRKWNGEPARLGVISQGAGGRKAALKRLDDFLENSLRRYARENREPSAHATSQLSSYLHFGHISSLEIALAVNEHAKQHKLIVPEFLEQLIVRCELAFNFEIGRAHV